MAAHAAQELACGRMYEPTSIDPRMSSSTGHSTRVQLAHQGLHKNSCQNGVCMTSKRK